jgi:PAS domain S-box-containing protein
MRGINAMRGVIITTADGVIQFVNPGFEVSAGLSREAVVGQSVDMLKDQAPDQALYQNLWHTIAVGKQWRGRFKSKRADGSCRISEASIAPVRDTGGRIVNYVSVERDITEHVAVSEQLMRVQKMESVGRLAGGVAHDFNNLLQVILGHAELAQEELGTEHPVCADLRMIR